MIWLVYRVETYRARGLITRSYFGMEECTSMEATTARRGLETCTNAALRTRSTSGRRLRVKVSSHSTGLVTLQSCSRTRCSSLEDGMAMIPWMISSSTVSFRITGMRFIVQMAHLLSLGIGILLLSVEAIYTFLEESIPISSVSMTFTNLISTKESGQKWM